MTHVLVTRPLAQAEEMAARLRQAGFEATVEPLLTILPTGAAMPGGAFDAVIFTSGNACEALAEKNIAALLDLPCFCVGVRTAEKVQVAGFEHVEYSEDDGAALARLVDRKTGGKARILHIAARETDGKARTELEARGHQVEAWPIYEARAAAAFSPATGDLLANRTFDAALFFSPRTAQIFAGLAANGLEACCASMAAIGLSDAVCDPLRPLGWRALAAAAVPSEDAVLACLQRLCPVKA